MPSVGDIRGRSTDFRLACDIRPEPASNAVHHQTLGLPDPGSRIPVIAGILNVAAQIKGGLLGGRVVSRVFHFGRLRAKRARVLLAGRRRSRPFTVAPARSLGQADGVVIRIAGVMRPIAEELPRHRHYTVLDVAQHRTLSLGLDARHPANTVASAFLLLALAILVR